jgi:hypothetical protein
MSGAVDFTSICSGVTENFLRTAILIDDEAFVDREIPPPQEPLIEPAFLGAEAAEASQSEQLTDAGLAATGGQGENLSGGERSSDVDLKPLADAFLDQRIICAVLKPAQADEDDAIVQRAVTACTNADVVILDWFLRKGNAELSQRALVELLHQDREQNGRMRLVIVYTSATPLIDRRSNLETRLTAEGFEFKRPEGAQPTLKVGSTRIVFAEKSWGKEGTKVADLPMLAISEFAKEAEGLMPAFAMSAVAAVRDGTHHILSLFRSNLDPALLGHRMVLQDPSETSEFLLGVLLLQMKGFLTRNAELEKVLSPAAISAWFDHHAKGALGTFLGEQNIPAELAKASLVEGDAKTKVQGNENVKLLHRGLYLTEGADEVIERDRTSELARLSSHAREAEGFTPSPAGWAPHLTIGSIVRMSTENAEGGTYMLCTQPICDTVRLRKDTFFSFTTLTPTGQGEDFWLVVRNDEQHVKLRMNLLTSASTRHFAGFKPDSGTQKITARVDPETGKFVFEDIDGKKYNWVADLDQLKAQRAASEMASALGRVGLDEYEWLRRGGNLKG